MLTGYSLFLELFKSKTNLSSIVCHLQEECMDKYSFPDIIQEVGTDLALGMRFHPNRDLHFTKIVRL